MFFYIYSLGQHQCREAEREREGILVALSVAQLALLGVNVMTTYKGCCAALSRSDSLQTDRANVQDSGATIRYITSIKLEAAEVQLGHLNFWAEQVVTRSSHWGGDEA